MYDSSNVIISSSAAKTIVIGVLILRVENLNFSKKF